MPMLLTLRNSSVHPEVFARFKKEHPIESYTLDELDSEFRKLTGENAKDVLMIAGKEFDLIELRLLVHNAIIYENSIGGPKSSTISTPENPLPGNFSSF